MHGDDGRIAQAEDFHSQSPTVKQEAVLGRQCYLLESTLKREVGRQPFALTVASPRPSAAVKVKCLAFRMCWLGIA